MEGSMFCYQCQEASGNKGCTVSGRCGETTETANLQDRLVAELKAVALTLEGRTNVTREFSRFIVRAMSATLTDTNFNPDRIYALIDEAKRALKTLDSDVQAPDPSILSVKDPEERSYREMLVYGVKGVCAFTFHALALGYEDNAIYNFIIKALSAAAKPETTHERLALLIVECGRIASIAMALLDEANTDTYGSPTMTQIPCEVGSRPGILMSGQDLKDLEELLIQTEHAGIDVYTHGELLSAHTYPALRKYPHLRGNYGGSWWTQPQDFASFNGPIVVNSNCITPVQDAYRGRIFTTGMVGCKGVPHITHRHIGMQKDFSAVIELARTLPPPAPLDDAVLTAGFGHHQVCSVISQIARYVESGSIRRFIVIAGSDGRDPKREYYTGLVKALPADTVILTAGCAKYRFNKLDLGKINGIPRILDAGQCGDAYSLVRIVLELQNALGIRTLEKLPVSFVFSWYEQRDLAVFLSLLTLGFKNIRLGPAFPAFFAPSVVEVLTRDYGVKPIDTPEADAEAMMAGN